MAYQFADSYDHYNTPSLIYDSVVGTPTISGSFARFPAIGTYPNQGMNLPSGASVAKNLKSNQATLVVFISFGCPTLPSVPAPIITFYDATAGDPQFVLALNPSGALQFYNPFGSTYTAKGPPSATSLISTSTVPNHGIEMEVTICPHSLSTGSIQLWLDGNVVIPLTASLTTGTTSNSFANRIVIGGGGGGGGNLAMCTDYIRVWDNTGSFQNAPTGTDARKITKTPVSAGILTQWSPNPATAANYACVNIIPPQTATYVSSAGNLIDAYNMGTAGFANPPYMTVPKSYVEKDDGATRAIQIGIASGTATALAAAFTVGSSYVFTDGCISTDPATGLAPTAAAADAFQFLKFEST